MLLQFAKLHKFHLSDHSCKTSMRLYQKTFFELIQFSMVHKDITHRSSRRSITARKIEYDCTSLKSYENRAAVVSGNRRVFRPSTKNCIGIVRFSSESVFLARTKAPIDLRVNLYSNYQTQRELIETEKWTSRLGCCVNTKCRIDAEKKARVYYDSVNMTPPPME